ncbi:hypothetical protein [Streptomyces sp. Ag109_G2-15]|uniref:hypothetical protein n=1 Tax=Streptomyces sp. Ag109_G2-15 TaxID=1938850 RepID=UPI000BDC10D3|nr:hypothetical protein [Streptomyces sp. Ag109_G2-15]SOD85710.1 hypothetical protein SAMN06272765_3144 [Streptomyces sp. Ag109_G2-15]
MGIESDQVVYEYLSRVGDIAQQRQLPSSARMRLVSELRNEIDRHRAKVAVDSPAAVRRILDRLGTPDEVVEAAGSTTGVPRSAPASVPVQREPEPRPEERPKGLRRVVPRPRPAEPEPRTTPSPPHLATADELGDSATHPDWWRVEGSPFGTPAGDAVPGFVGGVEIPDLLKRPPTETGEKEPEPRQEETPDAVEQAAAPRRRLFARKAPAPAPAARRLIPAAGWSNPLLLLAAAALVAGAVLGNWFALLLGWLIAYGSRRLTPAETKWAVLGVPGLALASGLLWLWGRNTGRWGTPIPQGHMNDALAETWPWVVRGAAVASALFLVWRSQRKR